MKNLNKLFTSIVLSLGLVLAPFVLTGCKTTDNPEQQEKNIKRIASACKVAAYIGSSAYLAKHPENKGKFELAKNSLATLEGSETLDFTVLLAIVKQLPVEELKSPEATIAITSATLILSDYAGELPLDRINELKPVVVAIREGIDLALLSVPAQ
jgi:hypothetical protein